MEARSNVTPNNRRTQLPSPLRIASEDGTLRLTLTSFGVSLVVLGAHEFHWLITKDGLLAQAGPGYARGEAGHDTEAASVRDCPGCRELVENNYPGGGR